MTQPDPDDFSDSDLEWYGRLGPGPHPPAQTPAQREGDALKQAMRVADESLVQRPEVSAELTDEARRARLAQVKARLAGQAAVAAPAPAAPNAAPPSPGWVHRLRLALEGLLPTPRWPAAAALAMTVVAGTVIVPVWMNQPVYELPGELKGADDVRDVAVPRPRQAAEAFAADLTSAGLKPGLFQRGKSFIVDIDVDRAKLFAASPAFTRIGLQPRLGFTRVEFDPVP